MFDPTDKPRVFGLPAGVDFAKELADGLVARLADMPPEAVARTEVYLNTSRMQRRVRQMLDNGPARLLPRLRLVTDIAFSAVGIDLPPPVSKLRRRLELSPLVSNLLDKEPELAPRSAIYDLSDSLAKLMDEMHGEGVPPEVIGSLDVTDKSDHWERAKKFILIIQKFFDNKEEPDTESRQRQAIERLIAKWEVSPPQHPVIVAGSTGSRGATALFMDAVARLPQGAIVLPGLDYDLPAGIWDGMDDALTAEDHPQFRFRILMERMGLGIGDIPQWTESKAPSPDRNRVVSLSLRPAPVTHQWLAEGPNLPDLTAAMQDVTLVEAPTPRSEAETIALRLRAAIDEGITAAVITPDRMLTRQIAAALDRWLIVPDDSAGQPLHLSPPGRLLRQVAGLRAERVTGEALLSLLKHPLTATGSARNEHIRLTHELELHIRRHGPAYPVGADLRNFGAKVGADWGDWVASLLDDVHAGGESFDELPLTEQVARHIALAERVAAGPDGAESELWKEAAGRKALQVMNEFRDHAEVGGNLNARDYAAMVGAILQGAEVRNPDAGHPQVLFWGTLEARVQSADLVILAGMNDGTWPESPAPDPWLNRAMRKEAGLLMPERRIGLSAHDYQLAVAAPKVWITRSIRSDEAETVPSRWINRLVNLLRGLPDKNGPAALDAMRAEGQRWVRMAHAVSAPVGKGKPAHRPSPQPPVDARPKELSVTQIQKLIRDPYEIYARKVLKLNKLDPLVPSADAPLRGDIFHAILEEYVKDGHDPAAPDARETLMAIARRILDAECPWPTVRKLWLADVANFAGWFLETETARRTRGTPTAFEAWGKSELPGLDFSVKGKADRIDVTPDGQAVLYDYKAASVPTEKQQLYFDKQLLIEAAMVARGGFEAVGTKPVAGAEFIGLTTNKVQQAPFDKAPYDHEWARFIDLIKAWQQIDRGYTAQMAAETSVFGSDYDHLSRYGEWDLSVEPTPERLK